MKLELATSLRVITDQVKVCTHELALAQIKKYSSEITLEQAQNKFIRDGIVVGKNETERKAHLSSLCDDEELDVYQGELQLINARSSLRCAELELQFVKISIQLALGSPTPLEGL